MRESVVVIGGGAAGLAAAMELAGSHAVTLVEARERLGGRIWTVHGAGNVPIELGAEFVHGKPPGLLRLIKSAALQTQEVPDRHWRAARGSLQEWPEFWDQISQVVDEMDGKGADRSFLEILERSHQPREARELARDFVEGFHAAPVEQVSAKSILENEESSEKIDGQRSARIKGGYGLLIRFLERECRSRGAVIRTSTEVKAIDWRKRPLTLTLDGTTPETITADRAVVTLPAGVLRNGTVRLEPKPSEKIEALHSIESGTVIKVILQFRSRFWPTPNFGFIHAEDEWFPTWWADERGDMITAWAGGPAGEALSAHHNDFIVHRALETASKLFGESISRIRDLLLQARCHNWQRDAFACGAYSYVRPGGTEAARVLARPESEAIFFAGEATDLNFQSGTVHAAVASGQRVAREIRNLTRPSH